MIVTTAGLGRTYGRKRAVDDVSFTLRPGRLTGFLGPNGSGKSTTMRLMLGLDRGDGRTEWDGQQLRDLPIPARAVGAHLDAKAFHPKRTVRRHLMMHAAASGVGARRVAEVLDLVGLGSVADDSPGGFSLGMAQRVGLATAILAEPDVLMLDEPSNGLDPQSIQWLREFLRAYAHAGHTVFVSSHLLPEMQLMADHVVVIGRGTVLADQSVADFVDRSASSQVLVRVADTAAVLSAATRAGLAAVSEGPDGVVVTGASTEQVGLLVHETGQPVRELVARNASLEQAFIDLTRDAQEYTGGEVA
ncbi:ATP-binding cassette domain-containing protein [Cellulomonas sp. Leaf395]|uniref:ATP-binding cassette domain-containing protein n=1 Tax=Cellulomonas sp. Leaf395 TaxID=1736362 RepID=UPI0006FA6043|nr:ATP-binding cassette domain-containing protein [Cellulomonas sp. Leaf395]KQS98643.1 ABC transporter ATP-binding protein [Cellulomonas sp. Leaf395]